MIMTGILTGVVCVGINRVVETFVDWRNENMAYLLEHHGSWQAFGLVFAYGLTLTALAACMVRSLRGRSLDGALCFGVSRVPASNSGDAICSAQRHSCCRRCAPALLKD